MEERIQKPVIDFSSYIVRSTADFAGRGWVFAEALITFEQVS